MLLSEIILKIEEYLDGYVFDTNEKEIKAYTLRQIMQYTGGHYSPDELKRLVDDAFRYKYWI